MNQAPLHTQGNLQGRTAIVTGSGKNIGKAIALALARSGANVVINGHSDMAAVERVVQEARSLGVQAIGVRADVGDESQVSAMVEQAREQFGKVDIAVSNVSLRLKQPFLEITPADWQRVINFNLNSAFYLARSVIPGMKEAGFGRIIHISGVDGFAGHLPGRVHNIACKAAVHAMTKALTTEFAEFGITANTVAPGHIDTERDWAQYGPRDSWTESRRQHIPMKKIGHVDDVAAACVYLAGDSGAFVSGQAIHVNGGHYMF